MAWFVAISGQALLLRNAVRRDGAGQERLSRPGMARQAREAGGADAVSSARS